MKLTEKFTNALLIDYFGEEVKSLFINDEADCEDCCEVIINLSFTRDILEEPNFIFAGYNCIVKAGATKMVIIVEDCDEVIKINFDGEFHSIYDQSKFLINYETDIDYDRFGINFLETENDIYNKASDSLKHILLPNIFITNFGNIKIYKQKKISNTYNEIYGQRFVSENTIKTINKLKKNRNKKGYNHMLPEYGFISDILSYYGKTGEEIIQELNINDLHGDNYGYLDEQPIIFDYAY